MVIEHRTGIAGLPDDWDQEWEVPYSGSSPGKFHPTPQSGQLTISIANPDGTLAYWNGTAFVTGPEVVLATTIVGTHSRYPFTPPPTLRGRTVRFEGWMNDAPAVTHIVYVAYGLHAGVIGF